MSDLLIFRPEPGAQQTAARAAALGLDPVVAPIFAVQPLKWPAPAANDVDAVMLTSANAVRHAGPELKSFLALPCYAVGEATAREARAAGFADIRTGPGDGAALLEMARHDAIARVLHLCGRDHIDAVPGGMSVLRRLVYAAEPVLQLPVQAISALRGGALALLHSPRAGAEFARLVDVASADRSAIRIAAISAATADAAGEGWKQKAVAARPRDEALLELAFKLCKNVAR